MNSPQAHEIAFLSLVTIFGISGQELPPPPQEQTESVLFEKMPVVEAASMHQQNLQDAPGSVSVFTQEDIRKYGFRTLGEALSWASGFYMSYDRAYHYVGVRGFSLPGDYNTRVLVMVNGHYMTDNVYSSNSYFGQDFGLDMDLVERIEIIRGPSSVLYGSNGMFATINVVTRSPVDSAPLRISTETGSFGEKKVLASTALNLGRGVNLLISASVFNNSGQDLLLPEPENLELSRRAIDVDAERGYHFFANLVWRNWSFTALSGRRTKLIPTGWYSTVFDDRGNHIDDLRSFAEASYIRDIGADANLHWRIYYDQYRYHGRYDLSEDPTSDFPGLTDTRDHSLGDWAGTQLTYRRGLSRAGDLTLGGELNWDFRAVQDNYVVTPEPAIVLHSNNPDRTYGLFAQHEWTLGSRIKTNVGVRFDDSAQDGHFVSPRFSLTFQKSSDTTFKFLFGRAFRSPNAYELFYTDGGVSQWANPNLRVENINTLEGSVERRFGKKWSLSANVYHSRLSDLITAVYITDSILQYQNVLSDKATGAELELKANPFHEAEIIAGLAFQRTSNSLETFQPNSPSPVGKLRFYTPLFRSGFGFAAGFQYLSERGTANGLTVPPVYLADMTLTSRRLTHGFEIAAGIRNLFDRRYYDPVGLEHGVDRLPQNGRSFFVKFSWDSAEPDIDSGASRQNPTKRGVVTGSAR